MSLCCRRLVKAMAILVPPFGLLLVFTLYSPDGESHYKAKLVVDCVAAVILHLQGFLVAVVLCYSNAEILMLLRKVFSRRFGCLQRSGGQAAESSMMTGVSHLSAATQRVHQRRS
ncbi:hypothetical protein EB796_008136 [Bugula neritina]|uniref:Uncharacterized protein n=1 Tax=Bugula neritina TaxID=10212 RepID=A0A7J7K6G2_BUGNE|nr:hypothetical protein EB796_008136 [Bugula neritina]